MSEKPPVGSATPSIDGVMRVGERALTPQKKETTQVPEAVSPAQTKRRSALYESIFGEGIADQLQEPTPPEEEVAPTSKKPVFPEKKGWSIQNISRERAEELGIVKDGKVVSAQGETPDTEKGFSETPEGEVLSPDLFPEGAFQTKVDVVEKVDDEVLPEEAIVQLREAELAGKLRASKPQGRSFRNTTTAAPETVPATQFENNAEGSPVPSKRWKGSVEEYVAYRKKLNEEKTAEQQRDEEAILQLKEAKLAGKLRASKPQGRSFRNTTTAAPETVPTTQFENNAEGSPVQGETWKGSVEEYVAYRRKVNQARKEFLQKSEDFETLRAEVGFFGRMIKSPAFETAKRKMERAQEDYDNLLENWRDEREKIKNSFIEKQIAEKGGKTPEMIERETAYIARREAIDEHRVDTEAQILEGLRYNEDRKGESRNKLIRGVKAGFRWYSGLSKPARLGLGISVGLIFTGGGSALGYAARKVVSTYVGGWAALEAKRYGDKKSDAYGEQELKKQHETFKEKSLSQSREERIKIRKDVRMKKRAATLSSVGVGMVVGGGTNILYGLAENAVNTALHSHQTITPQGSWGDESALRTHATGASTQPTESMPIGGKEEGVAISSVISETEKHQPISPQNEFGGVESSQQPMPLDDLYAQMGLAPDGESTPSYPEAGPSTLHSHFQDDIPVDEPRGINTAPSEPTPVIHETIPQEIDTPKNLEIKGVYEVGSSVERELQDFLKNDEWVTKNYPGLNSDERGLIAHLILKKIEHDPYLMEDFNVKGGEWDHVLRNETFAAELKTDVVAEAIEKVHAKPEIATPLEVVPDEPQTTTPEVVSEPEVAQQTPTKAEIAHESAKIAASEVTEPTSAEITPHEPHVIDRELVEPSEETQEVVSTEGDYPDMRTEELAEKTVLHAEESHTPAQEVVSEPESVEYTPTTAELAHEDAKAAVGTETVPEPSLAQPKGISVSPDDYYKNHPPVEKQPLSLNDDLKQAQEVINKQGPDYLGASTRFSIQDFYKRGIFSSSILSGQKSMVLSYWGPISHVRLQDAFDYENSLSYTIGDNAPVTMGADVEKLTRGLVTQLERNLENKIPDVSDMVSESQRANETIGQLVQKLHLKLEAVEATQSTVEPADTVSVPPVEQSVETQPDTPQAHEVASVSAEIHKTPLAEYSNVKPALEKIQEGYQDAQGTVLPRYGAKLVPLEISEEVETYTQNQYLTPKHEGWLEGDARTLFENKELGGSFRRAVEQELIDIADALRGGKNIALSTIELDWSAVEHMTPAEVIQQLEQHKSMLMDAEPTIPEDGEIIHTNIIP